jgi:hypothetical protein
MARGRAKKSGSKKKRAKKKKNPARRVPVLVANPVHNPKKKKKKKAKRKAMAKKKKGGKRGKARNPGNPKKGRKKGRKRRRNPGIDWAKLGWTALKVTGAVVGGLAANMVINEAGASLSQGWKDAIRGGAALAAVGGGVALDQPVLGAALGAVVAYPVIRDRTSSLLPQLAMGDLGKVSLDAVSVRRLPDGRMVARLPDGRTMGMVQLQN